MAKWKSPATLQIIHNDFRKCQAQAEGCQPFFVREGLHVKNVPNHQAELFASSDPLNRSTLYRRHQLKAEKYFASLAAEEGRNVTGPDLFNAEDFALYDPHTQVAMAGEGTEGIPYQETEVASHDISSEEENDESSFSDPLGMRTFHLEKPWRTNAADREVDDEMSLPSFHMDSKALSPPRAGAQTDFFVPEDERIDKAAMPAASQADPIRNAKTTATSSDIRQRGRESNRRSSVPLEKERPLKDQKEAKRSRSRSLSSRSRNQAFPRSPMLTEAQMVQEIRANEANIMVEDSTSHTASKPPPVGAQPPEGKNLDIASDLTLRPRMATPRKRLSAQEYLQSLQKKREAAASVNAAEFGL